MKKIVFLFGHNKYEMEFGNNKSIINIIKMYSLIIQKEINELIFLYKGKNLMNLDEKKNNKII